MEHRQSTWGMSAREKWMEITPSRSYIVVRQRKKLSKWNHKTVAYTLLPKTYSIMSRVDFQMTKMSSWNE